MACYAVDPPQHPQLRKSKLKERCLVENIRFEFPGTIFAVPAACEKPQAFDLNCARKSAP